MNRGQGAGGLAETQFQISRHRVGPGNVVERHHDQCQEQHRRNGADPIPVRRQNVVLVGGSRPAHQFERAEIGGEKTETGHEEVFAGVRPSPLSTSRWRAPGQNKKTTITTSTEERRTSRVTT